MAHIAEMFVRFLQSGTQLSNHSDIFNALPEAAVLAIAQKYR
jgi:hypothetical protein